MEMKFIISALCPNDHGQSFQQLVSPPIYCVLTYLILTIVTESTSVIMIWILTVKFSLKIMPVSRSQLD